MLEELFRLLREPYRYVATFRAGEIYIKELGIEASRHSLPAVGYVPMRGEESAPAEALSHGFRLWITRMVQNPTTRRFESA
jgi:hypothetical protein